MKTPNIGIPEENIAEILDVAEKIVDHTNRFEAKMEVRVSAVEKEINELKKSRL
ncbi:MAG: hypothetical protein UX89_C0005G0048 [Parcubacteria group bacterium GW2011_GWA2_47_16]|nr:MAG: hypothetical protein UX89_C0005G0048 [Parcubacteria group bacterium GW2011_GWA2_47_16]